MNICLDTYILQRATGSVLGDNAMVGRACTCCRIPDSRDAGPNAVVILTAGAVRLHVLDPAVPDGVEPRKAGLPLSCCRQPRHQPQQEGTRRLAECPESMQLLRHICAPCAQRATEELFRKPLHSPGCFKGSQRAPSVFLPQKWLGG